MAAKRDYKAEYAKRIARALEKGKTRQQARGHKPSEHVFRKPPPRKRVQLDPDRITEARERFIFKWGFDRANVLSDETIDPDEVVAQAKIFGWAWFLKYSRTWDDLRKTYLKELKSGRYASRGISYLQYLSDDVKAPDVSWLYYH